MWGWSVMSVSASHFTAAVLGFPLALVSSLLLLLLLVLFVFVLVLLLLLLLVWLLLSLPLTLSLPLILTLEPLLHNGTGCVVRAIDAAVVLFP